MSTTKTNHNVLQFLYSGLQGQTQNATNVPRPLQQPSIQQHTQMPDYIISQQLPLQQQQENTQEEEYTNDLHQDTESNYSYVDELQSRNFEELLVEEVRK